MIKKIIIIMCMFLLCACATETKVVYKSVYPSLPQLESPLILATSPCKFSYPSDKETNIFVGFDKENYKCYLKNQEINREQKLLYEKFIEELNKERQNWNNLNKGLDK